MPINKILVINDDTEDIAAIKERLSEDVRVEALSQMGARTQELASDIDLVVLDNDANNLQDAKGVLTLDRIRQVLPDTPVVYTSFQPGWVPAPVYQNRHVDVVATAELMDFLQTRFDVDVQNGSVPMVAPLINIMMTYNSVRGHTEGIHDNGRLVISCFDRRAHEDSERVCQEKIQDLYANFNFRADRDKINNVFVYDGKNAGEVAGRMAASLGHDTRMKVHLLACSCDWYRKQRLADSHYISLHKVECGGEYSMGLIADVILGKKKPGVNYQRELPMPEAEILQQSERYAI